MHVRQYLERANLRDHPDKGMKSAHFVIDGFRYRTVAPRALLFFPNTIFFESHFLQKFQTSQIKIKPFFYNRKLTSTGIVFCLNKTFFTPFEQTFFTHIIMFELTVFL